MRTHCVLLVALACCTSPRATAGKSGPEPTPPTDAPAAAGDVDEQTGRATGGPEPFEGPDGRFGFRDASGAVMLPPQYMAAYPFNERGVAFVVDEQGWACIDLGGKVLLRPFVFDNGPDYLREGLFRYLQGDKLGFADEGCNVAIPAAWDFAGPFSGQRAPVCRGCRIREPGEHAMHEGGVWGFIDKKGNEVVSLQWDFVYPFEEDTAVVERRGVPRRIDHGGKVLPPKTPVRFVMADTGARTVADALLQRREDLAACADHHSDRAEDGPAGFIEVVMRGGPQAAAPLEVTGFGSNGLHQCIMKALGGIAPHGRTGRVTIRLGTPADEPARDGRPVPRGNLVLHDDGRCSIARDAPCEPNKVCEGPSLEPVSCPDGLPSR